ncbi:MAG TPA: CvpA family protein [Mariprofundaceae bacterium]|nr:CvpA family protein [Mariprofundaceae bacterium]
MNFIDYILIAIVGLSMVLSLWRGFVREMISLIGLVAAFLIASRTSGATGDFLGKWVSNETIADIAGFVLVFVIIMILVALIGAIIRKLVDMADLTATDRTLGVFFGAARGLLLIALCFLVYTSYTTPDAKWLKNSMLTPYAISLGNMLGRAIPENYPFSRQGAAGKAAPQKSGKTALPDVIPLKDRQALKSIIDNSKQ